MTNDEFERNKLRFGDDIETWPAPYRQEARDRMVEESPSVARDDDFDRLVLTALSLETDERVIARRVMEHISAPASGFQPSLAISFLLQPARLAAGAAIILIAVTAGGYQLAQRQNDWLDSRLLAFATGAPLLDGEMSGIPGDPATEEGSL
jgi:hypothetical protein